MKIECNAKKLLACAALACGLISTVPPSSVRAQPYLSAWLHAGVRVLNPTDLAWVDSPDIHFSGEAYTNGDITPQLLNRQTGQWETMTEEVSEVVFDGYPDSPDHTDVSGTNWYKWHGATSATFVHSAFVAPGPNADDGQRRYQFELRFVDATNEDWPYTHFSHLPQRCIDNTMPAGNELVMLTVADQCAVPKNSVSVYVSCGHAGQGCCVDGNECDGDLECRGHTCRTPQPPPPSPPPPRTGPVCGDVGQECCNNTTCSDPGSVCAQDTFNSPLICQPPGNLLTYTCFCTDNVGGAQTAQQDGCFSSGVDTTPRQNALCMVVASQLEAKIAKDPSYVIGCSPYGIDPTSHGTCTP
jgi:hypothetical protein